MHEIECGGFAKLIHIEPVRMMTRNAGLENKYTRVSHMVNQNRRLSLQHARKLQIVLILTSAYFGAEVVGALVTDSLALLADAGHMLTDVGGLVLALLAISFSSKPATPQRTYGFYRMEILASLANSVALVSLSIYIMYEAYTRIISPPEVQSITMIAVAVVGLAVNFAGVKILGKHSHSDHEHEGKGAIAVENLNIEGARLEVLSDALGSVGVIAAGLVIMFTGFYLADTVASIALALFILPRTWLLLKKSIHVLMEGTPSHISYEEVKNAILGVRGVTGLFELHIWTITSGMNALSAHVIVIDMERSQEILREISSLLEKRFGITRSTIQIESYHPDPGNHNF